MVLVTWFKRIAPFAISAILLAAVIWWVSPKELAAAAAELNWKLLAPATIVMVFALFFWDALCLPAVYRIEGHTISYWQSLRLRGLSYFGGALNYELGQAGLAWGMARIQKTSIVRMLTRSVLLAYHDILLLLVMGYAGSLLSTDPLAVRLRPLILTGVIVALLVGGVVWLLPQGIRARFRWADSQSLLDGWSAARSLRLLPLRFVYFGILIVYGAVALSICQIAVDRQVVLSTIPLMLLADGLPNFAGLGTRETTLQLLLSPGEPSPIIVAMSLFWTVGMFLIRIVIALVFLLEHQRRAVGRQEGSHE